MQRIPIILDTDPGNDIDDAIAIAYLLAQPQCQLVGITTVSGDVQQRAAIVEVLCNAAGQPDVPIVCGKSLSVLDQPSQPGCRHYEAIAHLPHRLDRPSDQAVPFILDAVNNNPGEIVLLSIGPLTNIAQLLEADPSLPSKLKGFYSMAGAFWSYSNKEWNCICDGEASKRMCEATRPDHYWYGLDVTTKCQMKREEFRAALTTPTLELVGRMAETWFKDTDHVTFHDPLAAACIFEPDICLYLRGKVHMDGEGVSSFDEGAGDDLVASEVDSKRFFNHLFSVIHQSASV